jgi:hypothetical protein
MRRLLFFLALAGSAAAQAPKIGEIHFYGLKKLAPEKLLAAMNIKTGDPLPGSKGDLEERLQGVAGVVDVRIEAVCCEGAAAALFIGVEERGAPHFDTHTAPAGAAAIPDTLMDSYHAYLIAVARAAHTGGASEDLSAGHSRMADPDARRLQDEFAEYAAAHLAELREVLRDGSEPEQRAVAAAVIGYAPKKSDVVNDLQYALQDADDAVRANAARSLKAIAVLAQKIPSLGLKVAPVWFVEMLNSISLSDRVEAAQTLVVLTEHPTPSGMDLLRERGMGPLVEMARWSALDYALPAFLLVGRTAGIPDEELQTQWQKGDRETAIRKALSAPAAKPKR